MNALIDTNIVLDVLLQRQPHVQEATQIWTACETGRMNGYLVASTLTDIFYITRRTIDRAGAFNAAVDRAILEQARLLSGNDFEDNVQIACAVSTNMDAIVTRDPKDFAHSPIPVLTPQALLAQL